MECISPTVSVQTPDSLDELPGADLIVLLFLNCITTSYESVKSESNDVRSKWELNNAIDMRNHLHQLAADWVIQER